MGEPRTRFLLLFQLVDRSDHTVGAHANMLLQSVQMHLNASIRGRRRASGPRRPREEEELQPGRA